jgi:hypothetical protein
MKTPAGIECPYFYGDYYRGRNLEECRLLQVAGQRWTPDLCKTCPVPAISRANACENLKLNPTVGRPPTSLFQKRVQLHPYCEKAHRSVPEPQVGCGECHLLPFKIEIKD